MGGPLQNPMKEESDFKEFDKYDTFLAACKEHGVDLTASDITVLAPGNLACAEYSSVYGPLTKAVCEYHVIKGVVTADGLSSADLTTVEAPRSPTAACSVSTLLTTPSLAPWPRRPGPASRPTSRPTTASSTCSTRSSTRASPCRRATTSPPAVKRKRRSVGPRVRKSAVLYGERARVSGGQ